MFLQRKLLLGEDSGLGYETSGHQNFRPGLMGKQTQLVGQLLSEIRLFTLSVSFGRKRDNLAWKFQKSVFSNL